jgi:hypothetical protein
MLWTSIATGKRPTKHGIHGFSEPLPDGSSVRPITTLGRKAKAVWNILNQNGARPSVMDCGRRIRPNPGGRAHPQRDGFEPFARSGQLQIPGAVNQR